MQDLIGRTLGHYSIVEKIGEGGMGEVYRARDGRLDRDVAIKVLHQDVAQDADRLARFEREAKALAALNHPYIATIHGFETVVILSETDSSRRSPRTETEGRVEGSPEESGTDPEGIVRLRDPADRSAQDDSRVVSFLVMELLDGESLRQRILPGGMAWKDIAAIGVAVTEGLAAAHRKNIVHRDLKPENIFLTFDGRVKILDFGLARMMIPADEEAETATLTPGGTVAGTVMGTVGYMSPEQAAGRAVDTRSDLFSLGTVLFEMLTGRRPFEGDTAVATLAALLRDDPPPMPGVEPKVERLVERCLAKGVNDRFQSAVELKSAIEKCLTHGTERERPSIAVLPFTNMSGVEEDDYLCEGLAEEIINVLTRIPGLQVIARTSSFTVGRMGLDVCEAGARLNVGHILEGSVRRAGQQVRITAQLVTTGDGSHLWSERFDRELTDVLALEDEIADAIADRLRVELRQIDHERRRSAVDPEAHTSFLEGRHFFAKGTPEAMARAKECFERAIELDPAFALAFDSLAELYWYLGFFGGVPPREAFSQGMWHALRALELDDTLAETHALLGMLRKELDYNWPEVDREFRRAHDLNRDSPVVRLRYAISGLLPHGRIDEAAAEVEAMLHCDPLSLVVRWWVATMAYLGRRQATLIDEGQHMVSLDPVHFLGHLVVGLACTESGEPDEAVTALEKAYELSGGIPITRGYLTLAYGRAGRREDASKLLEQAEAMTTKAYVPPSTLALGYVGLDDWDLAFHWWGQAVEVRDPVVVPIKTFPFFDPVRGDHRYRELLRRMDLSED